MRKITFLCAMLLMCFSVARVSAQNLDEYGMVPLITDASMFESPFSDSAEGQNIGALCDGDASTFWHTDWHGEVAGDYHWLQVNFAEPISGDFVLYMLRRAGAANDHPTKIAIDGSNDGESWSVVDTLSLAFAGAGTAEISKAWKLAEPMSKLRFTVLDMAPADPGFRKYWHAAEIQIYDAGGEGLALYTLNNILVKYDGYLYGETLDIGNMPGQYSNVEAWEAFLKDLQWVNQYINGEISETITSDQAAEISARIDANYQAVLDSEVPLDPVESGYYMIGVAMEYTQTSYKLDENGDTIYNAESGEPEIETTHPKKAMYANGNTLSWKNIDPTDCNFLFRLDYNAETNAYKFYNCANNGRVSTIEQSTNVVLSDTLDATESEIVLNLVRKEELEDGTTRDVLTISRADQNSGYTFLHQGGHNGGTGVSGTIVGWEYAGASEWYLIPVDEAEAEAMVEAWAPIRDRELMLQNVASMTAEGSAALVVAEDVKPAIPNLEYPLIADASQITSPHTEANEGSIEALLDGDASTFWHSAWSGGAVAVGTHYMQVELTDPEALTTAAFVFTRRNVQDDHISVWGIYGTNEAEAAKEACEFLDEVTTPFTSSDETLTSPAFDTKGYKYIRFYINNTVCPGAGASRGYGHMAAFQLYPAERVVNETSQMAMLGALYTNLEAAIAAIPTTEDDITVDHYNALKAAYDAFMAKYVNPAPLRTAMANAQKNAATMTVGTLPGYWSEGADAALTAVIATATAYDNAGVYTAAKSEELIAQLGTETTNFFAKAKKVNTNKWYYIHMPSEEEYEANGWDKANLTEENTGLGNLFGQYVSTGVWNDVQLADTVIREYAGLDGEEVREGTALYFTNENGHDGSMFRFIAVGDTAYVIQNKATGLYIQCAGANNNNVTLGLTPTTFKPTAVGYGQLIFVGTSLDGVGTTNLHSQMADHRLVTWETYAYGSRSSMLVEEAEDVDFGALTNTFVRDVVPGKIYAQCYPVSVSVEEGGMYTVAGTYTDGEKNFVALNEILQAEAGDPFIFIQGLPEDWTEPAEGEEAVTEEAHFIGGNEVVCEADSVGGLVGTFSTFAVEKGTTIFADNMAKATTAATTNVAANNAFLRFGWTEVPADGDYSLVIEIDGEVTVTAIENVLNNVAKTGNVYDLNGRLVRTNATLNDVKALGRGMYILNGTKVLVK